MIAFVAQVLPDVEEHILDIHNALTIAEQSGGSIIQRQGDDAGTTIPFEESKVFKELSDLVRDGQEQFSLFRRLFISPERRQQTERFERDLCNSLQQIVTAQAGQIRRYVLSHETHLYDENALVQRVRPMDVALDRVDTLLRDRAKRLSDSQKKLLTTQWETRIWGALSSSLSVELSNPEDPSLTLSRAKSLFGVMGETPSWPPSWQQEAMVMATHPHPEEYRIPDQAMSQVFQRESEDAALQVYAGLLFLRQSLIAGKANEDDRQWVENRLTFTWDRLSESARKQITDWAIETIPNKGIASALHELRNQPLFPLALQLQRKWSGQSALSPEALESIQHDAKMLEQQLESHSSVLPALEQTLEKTREQYQQAQELLTRFSASYSAGEGDGPDILSRIHRLLRPLQTLLEDIEKRHTEVRARISAFNIPLIPQNSRDLQDCFLQVLKMDSSTLSKCRGLLSQQRTSEEQLERTQRQLRLFEMAYRQKERLGEIKLLLDYFEKENVDAGQYRKTYEKLRERVTASMARLTSSSQDAISITNINIVTSEHIWENHIDAFEKQSTDIEGQLDSLAAALRSIDSDKVKLNDFILATLTQQRDKCKEKLNSTQLPERLAKLQEDQRWLDSITIAHSPNLSVSMIEEAKSRIASHYNSVFFHIHQYSRFEKLLSETDAFVRKENSPDRPNAIGAGRLLERLETTSDDGDIQWASLNKQAEQLKVHLKWVTQLSEYRTWAKENSKRINEALTSTDQKESRKLNDVLQRIDAFIGKVNDENRRTIRNSPPVPQEEVQTNLENELKDLKRLIKAHFKAVEEPEDLPQREFLLQIITQMSRDLISYSREWYSTATPHQDAVTQWREQYRPAVTDKYIAKKAKPDIWSSGMLSGLRSEKTLQDKATKRVAFTSLLDPIDSAAEDNAATSKDAGNRSTITEGEPSHIASGQNAVATTSGDRPNDKTNKDVGHEALSNQKKREYLEEFSIVLQAALRATYLLAPKDTHLYLQSHNDFQRFIAEQCCKELIRSEHLNTFFTRWDAAKKHDDSPIEKMAIAASAVINIIDILKRTKLDKALIVIKGTVKSTAYTVAFGTVIGAIILAAAHEAVGRDLTLHPSIRKQFTSLNTDFVNAIPPAGLSWHIPEHVTDLEKFKNVTFTSCRISPILTERLAYKYRNNKQVNAAIRETYEDNASGKGKAVLTGNPDGNTTEEAAARKHELVKEKLIDVISADVHDSTKVTIDKRGKSVNRDPLEIQENHAYVDLEAWDDAGDRHYYRVPLAVLLQQKKPEEINPNLSHDTLRKAIFVAVSSHVQQKKLMSAVVSSDIEYEAQWNAWYNAHGREWKRLNEECEAEGLTDERRAIDLGRLRTKAMPKSLEQQYREGFDAYRERFGHTNDEQAEIEARIAPDELPRHREQRLIAVKNLQELKKRYQTQSAQNTEASRSTPSASGTKRPSKR